MPPLSNFGNLWTLGHRWGVTTKPGPHAREGKRPQGHTGSTGTGRALDYLSWKYALFKAGRTSCQEAATTANFSGSIDN